VSIAADAHNIAAADSSDAGADEKDHESADFGRQQRTNPPQHRRKHRLNQAGDDGHAEHQRQPAKLKSGNGRLEKNCGMARRTKKSAADRTARQGLQN